MAIALLVFGQISLVSILNVTLKTPDNVTNEVLMSGNCLLVGMMSNIEDDVLREWHRKSLASQATKIPGRIDLRFAVPVAANKKEKSSAGATAPMLQVTEATGRKKLRKNRDIIELNDTTTMAVDGFSTANTFDLMIQADTLLDS